MTHTYIWFEETEGQWQCSVSRNEGDFGIVQALSPDMNDVISRVFDQILQESSKKTV